MTPISGPQELSVTEQTLTPGVPHCPFWLRSLHVNTQDPSSQKSLQGAIVVKGNNICRISMGNP